MIYFAADVHLGSNIRKDLLETASDGASNLLAFYEVLQKASDSYDNVMVVLAGDTFERTKTSGDQFLAFSSFLKKCEDIGIKVYHINGNHDKLEFLDQNSLCEACGSENISGKLIDCGVKIYSLDFMYTSELKQALKEVPECDILVLHSPFEHMLGYQGAFQLSITDIPPQVKHVVSGDVHNHLIQKMDKGTFVSPGSLQMRTLAEDSQKCVVAYDETTDTFFREDIECRSKYSFCITDEDELDAYKQAIAEIDEFPKPLVYVKYSAEFKDIPVDAENCLIFTSKLPAKTEETNFSTNVEFINTKKSLEELGEPVEDAVAEFCCDILDSKDPRRAFKNKFKEIENQL